jgi:2-polyprenyl-3-methyl-5-hydroxy-6-metoxy-1,4-benzoquinol methylase
VPEFVEDYPIDQVHGAPYNPRRLSDEAFERLKQSLTLFGCVKPVLVNRNGTLIAGHQRTKSLTAIGQTTVPAVLMDEEVAAEDEIRFNLLHNSIETTGSHVTVPACDDSVHGWEWLSHDEITVLRRESAAVRSELNRLITQYGAWGSIVADHNGRVILNNDYAVASVDTRKPVLCYRVSVQEADELITWLDGDYGVYDYTQVGVKAYNQHWAQMYRLAGTVRDNKSVLYENHVMPHLKDGHRIVDFGAGGCAYAKRLKQAGWKAHWYEPHMKGAKANALDVAATVSHIRDLQRDVAANGLYDVVVLDSVLNSITSLEFERFVLTAVNSLCAADGTVFIATRHLRSVKTRAGLNKHRTNTYRRSLEFIDDNGFSAAFRFGVWTMQRFHSRESLTAILEEYFGEVEIVGWTSGALEVACRKPLPVDPEVRRQALEMEFNMEYPGGYRHNRHKALVGKLMELCGDRDDAFREDE